MTTWTSAEVIDALRTRYTPPEWYLLTEVADGTGFGSHHTDGRRRFVDGLAVNAYQSGKFGAEIHAFEVKVSRADFQHEIADPNKAEAVRRFCDRFYLVVPYPHDRIVRAGELPPGWGLFEASLGKVKAISTASKLDAAPATRAFIAAMVRRAFEERSEKEAQKAALLKAPMRQVMLLSRSDGRLILTCGHAHQIPAYTRTPKSVRCLACVDGLPTAADFVEQTMTLMSPEALRKLAKKAEARASQIETAPWLYAQMEDQRAAAERQRAERIEPLAATGDPQAAQELLHDLSPLLHAFSRRRRLLAFMEPEDIRQEAAIAILQATHAYDPSRGPFFALATIAIQNHLRAVVSSRGRLVRSTRHAYRKAVRSPSPLPLWLKAPVSLDQPLTDDTRATRADLLLDASPSPEATLVHHDLLQRSQHLLHTLDPRDAHVLRERAEGVSLDDLAEALQISRERVRQIEAHGLRVLKHRLTTDPFRRAA